MALAADLEKRATSADLARNEREETVLEAIERQGPEIARALPIGMTPERFTRIVVTAVKATPALQQCAASSLLGAVMLSAQLGLEPGPLGHAYFVPFGNKVTFIVGYKGMIDLAMRSGRIESIVARDVRENDEFDYSYGTEETISHKPAINDRGAAVAYYAIARLVGGGKIMHVMSRSDIELHRNRSRSANNGPWKTDYDAMARKTVIRAMSPYLPMSTQAAQAMVNDDIQVDGIAPDLAERVPERDVIDVEEVAERPHVLGESLGDEGAAVHQQERESSGFPGSSPGPSPAPPADAADDEDPGVSASPERAPVDGSGDVSRGNATSPDPVVLVNAAGASQVAMRCAEAGVGDDRRAAFLWAFSAGEWSSSKEVPVDRLDDLWGTLADIRAGTLVLVTDPNGENGPYLCAPDEVPFDTAPVASSADSSPVAVETMWRELLANTPGVAQAGLLRHARDVAGEHGLPLPGSLGEIPRQLDDELRGWLDQKRAS